ncbi:Putative hemolysin C [Candidatus Megaera polyxenophila]|nr:HlyC/CorC family transporter [Rickettsiales bacterium]WPX99363.1 Putative hemolysin C [Candidatus Megaera polyxenophila]
MVFLIISLIIGLLAFGALMAAGETSITASAPGKLHKLKSDGNKRASTVLKIIKIKDRVISTLLIGNSLSNTLCTTIATSLFIDILGDDMGTVVASIVMSFVIIVFSEVVPKAIAVAKPEKIALFSAPAIVILLKLFKPLNILLAYVVRIFCFIFRINLKQEVSVEDEVRGVIEHHMHEGNVVKDDRDMLGGILDIRNMVTADIMIHRSKVFAISIDTPNEKLLKTALASNHTRIPIWEKTPDNIIGILHIKDLVRKIHGAKINVKDINVRSLLKTPIFVPDNALLTQQLQIFKEGQSHLACVVDEYGDLQGIITMEDVIEEVFGQIYDEHDYTHNKITKTSQNEYIIDGTVSVRDVNRELGWDLPETDATTIAGFVINEMKRIPNEGEFITIDNLKIVVKKKTQNRIKSLSVFIHSYTDENSD